jgi:hypothetical protein
MAWLGDGCLEFYLLLHWIKSRPSSKLWYLTQSAIFVLNKPEPPPEEDIHRIRDQILWREGDPMRPVAFVMCASNHYFCVVFDYMKDVVYIFGISITRSGVETAGLSDWESWNGHHIWKNTAILYSWAQPDTFPSRTFHINWPQVGFKQCMWMG